MQRSSLAFWQQALAAALVVVFALRAEQFALAQENALPAQPVAAESKTSWPPPSVLSAEEQARQKELARLYALRAKQLTYNRRWLGPAITLGLGALTMITGGLLFAHSVEDVGACDEDEDCGNTDRVFGAGLVMMIFIGPLTLLVSSVLLVARRTRALQLRNTESAIHRLRGQVSLTPSIGLHGELELRLNARF